jgi:hypothetical protein
MTAFKNIVPVAHPELPNMYRVPVWVRPDEYTVCTQQDTYRYFDDQTVPPKLRAIITMIRAFPTQPLHSMVRIPGESTIYISPAKNQNDIGWRVNDSLYMTVLESTFLMLIDLKGK